ncbi:MAG: hypothetical protein GXP35_03460 [Actinobacteria bacterium]|nr:hypothetical protein [Actinomycetota bacterium]
MDAGYKLGDRMLYLSSPVLRGDDVSELQRRLGVLGFDTGRIDGKLGPETESALKDFQTNAGLPTDGICGADTINTFRRLTPRAGTSASNVTAVRETELIRSGFVGLRGRTVVLCEPGGLDSLTAALRRSFGEAGASVLTIHHPDWSMHARQANTVAADLVIALDTRPGQNSISYFAATGVESGAGRALAYCAAEHLESVTGLVRPRGLRLPILRETRMTAISCRFGDMGTVVRNAPQLASKLTSSVLAWVGQLQSETTYPQA